MCVCVCARTKSDTLALHLRLVLFEEKDLSLSYSPAFLHFPSLSVFAVAVIVKLGCQR